MDKDYNRIILPKSLDKGTSYRTAVWVANSIFARTGRNLWSSPYKLISSIISFLKAFNEQP